MDPTVLAVGNLKVLTGVGSLDLGADRSLLDNFGWRDSVNTRDQDRTPILLEGVYTQGRPENEIRDN